MLGIPKINLAGRDVIGVDEHFNGAQHRGVPLLIVGYYIPEYRKFTNGNEPYERKCFAYSGNPAHKGSFFRRAKEFFGRNRDFAYSVVEPKILIQYGYDCRATAMASVIAHLYNKHSLAKKNPVIVAHNIDMPKNTEAVRDGLENLLCDAGLSCDLLFKPTEIGNRALQKADRVGYYLGGIRYNSSRSSQWPMRHYKIGFDCINTFIEKHTGEKIGNSIRDKYDRWEETILIRCCEEKYKRRDRKK